MANTQNALGLMLSVTNFYNPTNTVIGGMTFLSAEESNPVCGCCGGLMLLVCNLNHGSLPLLGSMRSQGVSRLFICAASGCPLFSQNGTIETEILQTCEPLGWAAEKGCSLHLAEYSVCAQRVVTKGDTDAKRSPILITRKSNSTLIELQFEQVGVELRYLDAAGAAFIKSITLEDTEEGLRLKKLKTDRGKFRSQIHVASPVPPVVVTTVHSSNERKSVPREEVSTVVSNSNNSKSKNNDDDNVISSSTRRRKSSPHPRKKEVTREPSPDNSCEDTSPEPRVKAPLKKDFSHAARNVFPSSDTSPEPRAKVPFKREASPNSKSKKSIMKKPTPPKIKKSCAQTRERSPVSDNARNAADSDDEITVITHQPVKHTLTPFTEEIPLPPAPQKYKQVPRSNVNYNPPTWLGKNSNFTPLAFTYETSTTATTTNTRTAASIVAAGRATKFNYTNAPVKTIPTKPAPTKIEATTISNNKPSGSTKVAVKPEEVKKSPDGWNVVVHRSTIKKEKNATRKKERNAKGKMKLLSPVAPGSPISN